MQVVSPCLPLKVGLVLGSISIPQCSARSINAYPLEFVWPLCQPSMWPLKSPISTTGIFFISASSICVFRCSKKSSILFPWHGAYTSIRYMLL